MSETDETTKADGEPEPSFLKDAVEGDYVFWKSQGVSKIRLRYVIRSTPKHIYLQDHLFFDRKGLCVSEFRHGYLVQPTVDRRAKYRRQTKRFADTDRIHQKRLDAANREYGERVNQWALETVRDLAGAETEAERVELLLEAAKQYSRITRGAE